MNFIIRFVSIQTYHEQDGENQNKEDVANIT